MPPPLPNALPRQIEDQFLHIVGNRVFPHDVLSRGNLPMLPFEAVELGIGEALAGAHEVAGVEIDQDRKPTIYRDPAWRIPASRVSDFAALVHYCNRVDRFPDGVVMTKEATSSQWIGWATAWVVRTGVVSKYLPSPHDGAPS